MPPTGLLPHARIARHLRRAAGEPLRRLVESARAGDAGRTAGATGRANDPFASGAPLVPYAGPPGAAADSEYFTQGPFDFVETAARRARGGN